MDDMSRRKLKLAISEHELSSFLEGIGVYRLGYNIYAPGNCMINYEPAMGEVYSYYKEEKDLAIVPLFEDTLLEILQYKSGEGVFEVFMILRYQIKMEKEGISPFHVDVDKLKSAFQKAAIQYKDKLMQIKEYEGEAKEDGLWGAMVEFDEFNNKTGQATLLP